MSENIITLKDVTMRFNLSKEKVETIKEYTVRLLTGRLHFDEFYALNDINLEVKKGEAVGLIGVNGCGKSTLLKLISGIYYPTKGKVEVHGTIAPLIELGAGFDLELTARENIYLNGAVLGYDKNFMDQHFDDIVDFAELREFLDVPVKNFSSGMTARLGFAIATMVSADILIVDEILAVGDVAFQKKCSERMAKMLENGTTLILVSHNIDDVKRLCNKVVYIKDHHVYNIGDSETVCNQYLQDMGVM